MAVIYPGCCASGDVFNFFEEKSWQFVREGLTLVAVKTCWYTVS